MVVVVDCIACSSLFCVQFELYRDSSLQLQCVSQKFEVEIKSTLLCLSVFYRNLHFAVHACYHLLFFQPLLLFVP